MEKAVCLRNSGILVVECDSISNIRSKVKSDLLSDSIVVGWLYGIWVVRLDVDVPMVNWTVLVTGSTVVTTSVTLCMILLLPPNMVVTFPWVSVENEVYS